MTLTPQAIEQGFRLIEAAALAGERCPTNATMDNPAGTLPAGVSAALLKAGRIRIEVYPHNWRVIELVGGPNAGKRTASPPNKNWKPYRVLSPKHSPLPESRPSYEDHGTGFDPGASGYEVAGRKAKP